jgi:hypothetical protein
MSGLRGGRLLPRHPWRSGAHGGARTAPHRMSRTGRRSNTSLRVRSARRSRQSGSLAGELAAVWTAAPNRDGALAVPSRWLNATREDSWGGTVATSSEATEDLLRLKLKRTRHELLKVRHDLMAAHEEVAAAKEAASAPRSP